MMTKELITFDDVLIRPAAFCDIASRADVNPSATIGNTKLSVPVLSANMDTVTDARMARAMAEFGALGVLHRFCSIDENVKMLRDSLAPNGIVPAVSVGIGGKELERGIALLDSGATTVVIDVANGAQRGVVDQVRALREARGNNFVIVVGNVATREQIMAIAHYVGWSGVDFYKVGIGPGSACTTRTTTGVGVPQLSAIMDCVAAGYPVIADGGMRHIGDIAKALGAGAKLVMLGGMLAGAEETPGEIGELYIEDGKVSVDELIGDISDFLKASNVSIASKRYRGSASKESYELQGKIGAHRAPEGESFLVPYKGPVADVLAMIDGGLRSSMTYVNARNLEEFRENCEFVRISDAARGESGAHGKS